MNILYHIVGIAVFAALVIGFICCWILDCEEEDRRLGRKPRSSFWLR